MIRNPLNPGQISRISLSPDVVDCIVFWTKNPAPLLAHLAELEGFNFYFQFTLTPYGADFEPGLPPKPQLLETFRELSRKIGAERIIWRYDPIILSPEMSLSFHEKAFADLAVSLSGYTKHCIISFLDFYKKIERNLKYLRILPFTHESMRNTAARLVRIAEKNDLTLATCAEEIDLTDLGIVHGKCIDDDLITRLAKRKLTAVKDKTQRTSCGCVESIDIGFYNSCAHGCIYCYANSQNTTVKMNLRRHNPQSAMLIGAPRKTDTVKTRKTASFFDPQSRLL